MTRRRAIFAARFHLARMAEVAARHEEEAEAVKPAPAKNKTPEPEVVEVDLDREELAAQYEELFGKKPGNMKPETIAARIAEHGDSE